MRYPLLLLACLSLTGFTTQPVDERAAQSKLPQSPDKLWDKLAEADINSNLETGVISAKMPESIKEMSGKPLKISGFMMPLEAEEKFTHFLLSRRTPTCASPVATRWTCWPRRAGSGTPSPVRSPICGCLVTRR